MTYSDVRYLHSKRTVDDRALNQHVLGALRDLLRESPRSRRRVLEIGAGVGTMVSRLFDWNVLDEADYTLLDRDAASLEAARDLVLSWTRRRAGSCPSPHNEAEPAVDFVHGEAVEFLTAPENRHRFDLVVANAVLDLMDLRPALEAAWCALTPGAAFWFTINYDGQTIFLPETSLDGPIFALYDRTMDERVLAGARSGDSKTGRHLLELIPKTGGSLVAAGSSDWVVFPKDGGYPGEEDYFLHHIVNTVWLALRDRPDLARVHPDLTLAAFERWIASRHLQIERAELVYIAHQLDVVGRAPIAGRASAPAAAP